MSGNAAEQLVEQMAEMGFDDIQFSLGNRDMVGPVIHHPRMPVLAFAAPDRRCPWRWTWQVVVEVDHAPTLAGLTGSCSGVLHRVIVRAARRSPRSGPLPSGSGTAPAANGTAFIARLFAQASGREWIG